MITNNDKLTKRIINLNPKLTFVIFGLLIPFYPIWLRIVGLFVIDKNIKNKKLFDFFSIILIFEFLFIFTAGYFIKLDKLTTNILLLTTFFVWFISIGIASKNMIDFENDNKNQITSSGTKIQKYFFRFINLIYFPFSIYWIQKEINKYEKID